MVLLLIVLEKKFGNKRPFPSCCYAITRTSAWEYLLSGGILQRRHNASGRDKGQRGRGQRDKG